MRFRAKLCQHVIAAWESHYIPYQQLKALLKTAKRNGQEPSVDFYTSLAQAITANTAFSLQRYSVLQYDEEQFEKQWNDDTLAKHGPELIYLNLMILQEALIELLCFYRVNYEAMNRIYIKLVRCGQAYSPEMEDYRSIVRRHCAEHRKAYNESVDQLDRVQTRLATYQDDKFAIRVDPRSLDQEYQVVAPIVHESNNTSMTQSEHGRTPLHFGATYGMINLCMHVLSKVNSIEKYILLQDGAGFTPLHVSVSRGHVEVAHLLLSAIDKPSTLILDDLLYIALRREDDAMVELLVSRSVGLKHKSSSGESCLYIAAQLGREDYLRLLLPLLGSDFIDAAETACQWTPLFIGCVQGHISTVRLLLDAGADTTRLDYLGWTAQENAAFRGHLPVAELFFNINAPLKLSCSPPRSYPQRKTASSFEVSPGLANVILNLGGLQERKLSKSPTLDLPGILAHGLVLRISTSESPTSIERMVPLFDDPVDDTLVFAVQNPAEAAIIFSIHRRGAEQEDYGALIGTGVAFLYAQTTSLGARHGTLLREQSVPILCKDTLRLLGTITFSFLIVKPYYRPPCPSPSATCLEARSSVQLVGHRGLGQNSRERFLQLGENTIESFLAAGDQGATFVEVYVQLTKDLVPVLFHDYSLSESGTDVPIHDVTLDQFMHASTVQSPQGNPPSMIGSSENHIAYDDAHIRRPRSRSVTTVHEKGAVEVKNRMKHTVDYLAKGFKPNTRGDFVQDIFATLEDVLRSVPEDIGFDMEIKYPRIHEALEAGIAPISIDINIFVDTILDVIARYSGGRDIILSSFTPEICILLAIKQKSYPVLFITNAGKRPLSDKEKRAGSLQVAVRFAKQWGLAGIVVAADSLVMCPRLISFIKSQGLICGSYNGLNNEPANVEVQVNAGIDLVVADRVRLISQTLKRLGV
ncbi:Glycerophosphoryl diester phosphodiesterase family-domain-containing protein [Lophiotrema nucula]|uniref:Glycerophosphoryl diester phosphodiesterase family-domain-containing protein n=1 Tax=Lophiotrema nucula TaxID=690887 RepID=A0A6A5YG38_9PLEO|nr:Glycerophosphoryl diester phosphodiesterase family-domain-containing protein [Lophiotrema nucula]